jgi:hypothetical protein
MSSTHCLHGRGYEWIEGQPPATTSFGTATAEPMIENVFLFMYSFFKQTGGSLHFYYPASNLFGLSFKKKFLWQENEL